MCEKNSDDPIDALLKSEIAAALLAASLKNGGPSQAGATTTETPANVSENQPNDDVSETA